jgi:hypothetical protein
LECYKKALDISPDCALALNGRGCAEFGQGEWTKAEGGFLALLESLESLKDLIQPKSPAPLNDLASLKALVSLTDPAVLRRSPVAALAFHNLISLKEAERECMKVAPESGVKMALTRDQTVFNLQQNAQHNLRTLQFIDVMSNKLGSWGLDLSGWRNLTERNLARQQGQLTTLTGTRYDPLDRNVKGVDIDLSRAYVDRGNWPVKNWFGLAYPVKTGDTQNATKEKQ